MSGSFWDDRSINLAALAIPAFFIFAGLEFIAARRKRQAEFFSFEGSVANISIGIAERLLSLFLAGSFYQVFQFIHYRYALFNIPDHWLVWVAVILATDLVWYWYHRLGHEINILWAAHIVHHQSEEFNYTVSARITVFQSLIRNTFWCILPLAGFHPDIVMVTLLIHGTYSFFTHTQVIRNLGVLEYILITPSHHRVHHASNEKYLNKNYGDLFVFWDKIFGTFQKEEETPRYGLTHSLKSYSFVWQHFHYFMEIIYAASIARGVHNKLKVIFGRPEWLDPNIRGLLEKKYLSGGLHSPSTTRSHTIYLVLQIAVSASLVFSITLFISYLSFSEITACSLFILITLINCGALLEQRRWIYYLEHLRLLVITSWLSYFFESPEILIISLLFSMLTISPLQRWYLKLVYNT